MRFAALEHTPFPVRRGVPAATLKMVSYCEQVKRHIRVLAVYDDGVGHANGVRISSAEQGRARWAAQAVHVIGLQPNAIHCERVERRSGRRGGSTLVHGVLVGGVCKAIVINQEEEDVPWWDGRRGRCRCSSSREQET